MDTGVVKLFDSVECLKIVQNSLKAIKAEPEPVILSYSLEHGSGDLVGFVGEYYRLYVKLDNKSAEGGIRQVRYFVKAIPQSNEYHKAECERKGFFIKEACIYTNILPHIQRYAPTKLYAECYYTRPDVIVLEDLSAIPGDFRPTASKEIYTLKHHHVVLEHLAKLHTASLAWEMTEGVNIGEQFKDDLIELQMTMTNEWYEVGIRGILYLAKRHPKLQSPEVKEFISTQLYNVLSRAEQLTKPSTKVCNVLCHRDTWDRNIFYQYDAEGSPTGCLIVDFQLTQYSSPTMDVNFFIYVTTTREHRDEIYDELLDYYFETFQAYSKRLKLPEDVLTKEDFMADNKRARLAALILLAICEPLMKMPDGLAHKMRTEEQERFDYYMNAKRDELFERVMVIDPTYEAKIMAPIEELILYLMKNDGLIVME